MMSHSDRISRINKFTYWLARLEVRKLTIEKQLERYIAGSASQKVLAETRETLEDITLCIEAFQTCLRDLTDLYLELGDGETMYLDIETVQRKYGIIKDSLGEAKLYSVYAAKEEFMNLIQSEKL